MSCMKIDGVARDNWCLVFSLLLLTPLLLLLSLPFFVAFFALLFISGWLTTHQINIRQCFAK